MDLLQQRSKVRGPGTLIRHWLLTGGCKELIRRIAAVFLFKMARTKAMVLKRPAAAAKAAAEPAAPAATCDISGLAKDWDEITEVKDRVTEGGPILDKETPLKQEDIGVCTMNKDLLVPVLHRMAVTEKRALPSIDDLREQAGVFLTLCKRSGDLAVIIEETSQTVKKLAGFIKAKTRRWEVSTVARRNPQTIWKNQNAHGQSRTHILYKLSQAAMLYRCSKESDCMHTLVFGGTWFEFMCFLSWKSIDVVLSQVRDFQDLCLALDPMLQADHFFFFLSGLNP